MTVDGQDLSVCFYHNSVEIISSLELLKTSATEADLSIIRA
jgi:hypothetical protein